MNKLTIVNFKSVSMSSHSGAADGRRLWEIDFLRGIAIVLMVAYHAVYDWHHFYGIGWLEPHRGFWFYEGRLSAILFIGLAGTVSAVIAKSHAGRRIAWKKNLRRGFRLIGWGMAITVVTWLFDAEKAVWFGILHLLGAGIILAAPLLRFTRLNIFLGMAVIALGSVAANMRVGHYGGLIFGLRPYEFQTFDYYPLLPWFGVMLTGAALGNWWYKKRPAVIKKNPGRMAKAVGWAGRHSLGIYLIHQPVLLGILWLL